MMEETCGALIERLRQFHRMHDGVIRNRLIVEHEWLVRVVVNKFFGDTHFPREDLIQMGFMGLIRAVDKFNPDTRKDLRFLPYAAAAIANTIRAFLRRERLWNERFLPIEACEVPMNDGRNGAWRYDDDFSSDFVVVEKLRRAIDRLTPHQREVVVGVFYFGMEHREVAELWGRDRSAASTALMRALDKLRKEMGGVSEYADMMVKKERDGGDGRGEVDPVVSISVPRIAKGGMMPGVEERAVRLTPKYKNAYYTLLKAAHINGDGTRVVRNPSRVLKEAGIDPAYRLLLTRDKGLLEAVPDRPQEFRIYPATVIDSPPKSASVRRIPETTPTEAETPLGEETPASPCGLTQASRSEDEVELFVFKHFLEASPDQLLEYAEILSNLASLAKQMHENFAFSSEFQRLLKKVALSDS